MKTTKAPVFKGMKNGFAAVFASDGADESVDSDRIRIFHHRDIGGFFMLNTNEPENIEYNSAKGLNGNEETDRFQPCWVLPKGTNIRKQIPPMRRYDKAHGRKTIFLGYVKEID